MRIVKLRVKDAQHWASTATDAVRGGMFVPSTARVAPGDEVIVEIDSALLPNQVLVKGRVETWRPATPRARIRAGAEVSFVGHEQRKLEFIDAVMRGELATTTKRKFPRLPVHIPAQYRTDGKLEMRPIDVVEIGVGGALLATRQPLAIGTKLIIELAAPGAAEPLAISSVVSYHGADAATGIKFVVRDALGKRRLTELVRRFKEA